MDNRGITLLYVLMTLMVVSFIGVNLINVSSSDARASAFYGTSTLARSAAVSGKIAGMAYLEMHKDSSEFQVLMAKIKEFFFAESLEDISDSAYWLLGDANTYLPLGGLSDQGYRVKIEGVDKQQMVVSILVESYGAGGSKATCRTLYYLDGLIYDTLWDTTKINTFKPKAAFHMDGSSNYELNGNVTIQGLTILKGPLQVNGTVIFNGDLYQQDGSYTNFFVGNSVYNGKSYFGGDIDASATPVFNNSVGFGGAIRSKPIDIKGDVYHNGVVSSAWNSHAVESQQYNTVWDVDGDVFSRKSAYYNNVTYGETKEYLDEMCNYAGTETRQEDAFDIPALMGFEELPGSLLFDTTIFSTVTNYYTGEYMTSADMNDLYATAVANGDTTCGGFMILRAGGPGVAAFANVTKNNEALFAGKAIFIVDGDYNLPGFPKSDPSGNIVLYVKNRTTANAAEIKENYRGVIYVHESKLTIAPGNTRTNGIVYYSANSHQDYHSGGITHIYDSTVLEELSCLNLFSDSKLGAGEELQIVAQDVQLSLLPEYDHIETSLMATSF